MIKKLVIILGILLPVIIFPNYAITLKELEGNPTRYIIFTSSEYYDIYLDSDTIKVLSDTPSALTLACMGYVADREVRKIVELNMDNLTIRSPLSDKIRLTIKKRGQ